MCSVVDVAELCRNTHPSRDWVAAAEGACVTLHAFVAELNASAGLYGPLCAAQAAAADGRTQPLSPEGARVAASLRAEFERGGIHLAAGARDALRAAQAEAVDAGLAFSRSLVEPQARNSDGERSGDDSAAGRRTLQRAARDSSCPLLRLLRARADAASLLGYDSYAALATAPLLARTPAAPLAFCSELAAGLAPHVRDEMALMVSHRASGEGKAHGAPPMAWERPMLMHRARAALCSADDERAASRCDTTSLPCASSSFTRQTHTPLVADTFLFAARWRACARCASASSV